MATSHITQLFISVLFSFFIQSCKEDSSHAMQDLPVKEEKALSDSREISYPTDSKNLPSHLKNLLISDEIPSFAPGALVKDPDDLAAVCTGSGGRWHPNLYACFCENNRLFSPFQGCTSLRVTRKAAQCLWERLSKILEADEKRFHECLANMFPPRFYMHFSSLNSPMEDKRNLAEAIDSDGFSFLAGENYNEKHRPAEDHFLGSRIKITLREERLESSYEKGFRSTLYNPPEPGSPKSINVSPPSKNGSSLSEGFCRRKLQNFFDIADDKILHICSRIEKARKEIVDDTRLSFDSRFDTKICTFCTKNFARFSDSVEYHYSVSFKDFFALERVFYIKAAGFSTWVILSPEGQITNLELTLYDANFAWAHGNLNFSKKYFFNRGTEDIKIILKENTPLQDLWGFLKRQKSIRSENTLEEDQDHFGIHLVDNSLDLSDAAADTIFLNNDHLIKLPALYEQDSFLSYLKESPLFERPYFPWSFEDPHSLLWSLNYGVNPKGHGNAMAKILTKGLKNISLTVSTDLFDPRYYTKKLARDFLDAHKVKVVSTVISYFEKISSLVEDVIFDNPETVFIFAAGNYDMEDPELDPMSAAARTKASNVIIVAMYDPQRKGKVQGCYGQIPSLAVPMLEGHGTSYSSVQVGNLVAQVRVKYPDLSASEVVTLIHNHAQKIEGLAVRSQGIVDLNINHY